MSSKRHNTHARPKGMWVLEAIGQMRDDGYNLSICCDAFGCGRSVSVDLIKLCEQRGADYPIDLVRARARCSKCGARGKDVSIRIGYRGPNCMLHQTPRKR